MRPPRALYCEFPLGRPLGKPNDPAFQLRVLAAALALLERTAGPVLEDFPDTITDATGEPLSCPLPPRYDVSLPPPVDEARALRAAYERQRKRSGRTNVGQVIDADAVAEAVAALVRLADGVPLEEAGLPGPPREIGLDVRAYYEEAAIALSDHVPAARQAESWFYCHTETGATLKRAQAVLRASGSPESVWQFLLPRTQQGD